MPIEEILRHFNECRDWIGVAGLLGFFAGLLAATGARRLRLRLGRG